MKIPEIILIKETIEKFGYDPTYFKGEKDYKKTVIRTCFVCNNIYEQQFINAIRSYIENKKCIYCANKERSIANSKNHSLLMKEKIKNGEFTPPMLGKHHSDEVKQRARERIKGKSWVELYGKERSDEMKLKEGIRMKGENNPFYGKKHSNETIEFLKENSRKTTRRGKDSNFYGKNYNTFLSNEEFIERAIKKHGNKYDYSITNYTGINNNVDILCKIHGKFTQIALTHTSSGCGCPKCNKSKGEIKISNYLDSFDIEYIEQYKFDNCKNKNSLPFDFYLKDLNICIEYDGEQHFKIHELFGGEEGFTTRIENDKIKTNFCKENNIKLIRIPYYNFKDIEIILKNEL